MLAKKLCEAVGLLQLDHWHTQLTEYRQSFHHYSATRNLAKPWITQR